MLRKLEPPTFLPAMMLDVMLEGAVLYRIFGRRFVRTTSGGSPNIVGESTGFALRQAWLFRSPLVLIDRQPVRLNPPGCRTDSGGMLIRWAFVGLWCRAMALAAMQGVVLVLGIASAAS